MNKLSKLKLKKMKKMKKKIFLLLLLFTSISAMPLMAQSDGFFNYSSPGSATRAGDNHILGGQAFHEPMVEESIPDQAAPLGGGLLVLLASGMTYAVLKKKGE